MNRIARGILHIALAAALAGLAPPARGQGQPPIQSSLLLLIDVSGSMGDAIGSGNPQVKIEAAKQAAIDALGRAAQSGSVEVAVLAFAGDCQQPVPRYQDFTSDVDRLTQFVASLQPGGGTPMADALLFANRYMERSGRSAATDRMIMLLADGQNDCGDLAQAMASLAGQRDHFSAMRRWGSGSPRTPAPPRICARLRRKPAALTTMPRTPASSRTCSWSSWTR